MRVANRISRTIAVAVATSALAASVASCGALNEEGREEKGASEPSASSSAPGHDESPSATPASPSVSNGGENPGANDPGAATPDAQQPPVAPGGNQTPAAPGGNQSQPSPGGTGGIDSFEDIPESAKAKLDPTPLTQEEMQRGLQLPQEMMTKMVAGDAAGVCDMMVLSKDGTLVRFDVPELLEQCAAQLQTGIDSSSMKSMTPEQVKEASDPKHFELHDNGDGTATFARDGKPSPTKLARLDDGSLRLLVDNF